MKIAILIFGLALTHNNFAFAQSSDPDADKRPATVEDVESAVRRYSSSGSTVVYKTINNYQPTVTNHLPTDVSFDGSGKECILSVYSSFVCSAPKKRCAYYENVRQKAISNQHKVAVSYEHGYCSIAEET